MRGDRLEIKMYLEESTSTEPKRISRDISKLIKNSRWMAIEGQWKKKKMLGMSQTEGITRWVQ